MDNPFYNLFPSYEKAQLFSSTTTLIEESEEEIDHGKINQLLELIFLFTANTDFDAEDDKQDGKCVVRIHNGDKNQQFILLDDLENVLTERLLMENPELSVCGFGKKGSERKDDAIEINPVIYLLACYDRSELQKVGQPHYIRVIQRCQDTILQHLALCFIQPDMFAHIENASQTFKEVLIHQMHLNWNAKKDSSFVSCLKGFSEMLQKNSATTLETLITSICKKLTKGIASTDVHLLDPDLEMCINVMVLLSKVEEIFDIVLKYKYAGEVDLSVTSQLKTTLGLILCKSALITDPLSTNHAFFNDVEHLRQAEVKAEEQMLDNALDMFHGKLFQIFHNGMRNGNNRKKLLVWLGSVFHENSGVGQLWLHEQANPMRALFKSDAVFMNLAAVLVRLAQPFCISENSLESSKFLKIDPTYCLATNNNDRITKGVHMQDLHKETCFTKSDDITPSPLEVSQLYGFVSECFFMAHYSLHLGMHGLLVKFYRLTKEINRIQNTLNELQARGMNLNDNPQLTETFQRAMCVYLSTKGTLKESRFLDTCMKFFSTTASYLSHISCSDDRSVSIQTNFPLCTPAPVSLTLLPEFLIENVKDYMLFLKRSHPSALENNEVLILSMLTMCTIYMGNKSRMNNPHLRASLAEVVEAVLPLGKDSTLLLYQSDTFQKFKHVENLTEAVVQLFVDIEFTGDPHQFEQKFNYRRPLYPILKFLWNDPQGKNAIKNAAQYAVSNIESSKPPLLLQFINLFLNDSIFLLDEAIDYLTQIKMLELERRDGQWQDLPARERHEKERMLKELTMMARFHNVMSNETIESLAYLTEEIMVVGLFCQPSLIDRIASMLNSFLLKLVGPEMGKLKISDFSNCEFKPKELVLGICKVYINLGMNQEFPLAVAKDGRSYRPDLFPRAMRVMGRFNHSDIYAQLKKLSERMQEFQRTTAAEDEFYQDAPDKFFDPLLGTLMKDPVILPSSQITVDRSTIARHLLSDTTDPFNRQPLKLEDVQPNVDLAQQIKAWSSAKPS